jgi:hypothetical protein
MFIHIGAACDVKAIVSINFKKIKIATNDSIQLFSTSFLEGSGFD